MKEEEQAKKKYNKIRQRIHTIDDSQSPKLCIWFSSCLFSTDFMWVSTSVFSTSKSYTSIKSRYFDDFKLKFYLHIFFFSSVGWWWYWCCCCCCYWLFFSLIKSIQRVQNLKLKIYGLILSMLTSSLTIIIIFAMCLYVCLISFFKFYFFLPHFKHQTCTSTI